MTIILFLIILAVLIFVHELGHFTAAKLFGIRVDEFAIGFPQIASKKIGETKYAINLIPFGGYVKIFGENPDEESITGADSARALVNAAWWKQIIILLAGVCMNIVFAWILISISFNLGATTSISDQYASNVQNPSVVILSVLQNSPADKAGLEENDKILAITTGTTTEKMPNVSEVQNIIAESSGTLSILYQRGSATGTANMIATTSIVSGKVAIGISLAEVGTVKFGFFASVYQGAQLTLIEVKEIAVGMCTLMYELVKGNSSALSDVSGPVGIVSLVGQASSLGISYLLGFIALISINLAVLNAIPFPALDGGRAMFTIIEVIIRRKIKPAILNWANLIGFAILILLMLFVTYHDIVKLIK